MSNDSDSQMGSKKGGSERRMSERPVSNNSVSTVSRKVKAGKRPLIKSDMDDFKQRIIGAMQDTNKLVK